MEAITSIGNYDHTKGGHIIFWGPGGKGVVELAPGHTIIFPARTKRYSFVAVAPNETRFLFCQWCNAGVLRWIEKGGRSDTE
ncbi:hypothetical protein DFH09DRAFT_926679 [Mycena vulgaris]|nr:hypothetical protein DFH09DRAFT_926679 [Mycena vulgaris]